MDETCKVFWRGSEIGTFEIVSFDMMYMDCIWTADDKDEAMMFELLVAKFNPKEVLQNPAKGTRVRLKYQGSESLIHALVIGFLEGKYFIRQISSYAGVEWLVNNVI